MTIRDDAFRLFSQNYGANSPEVKALGLRYSTRKKYYWEWHQLQLGEKGQPPPLKTKKTPIKAKGEKVGEYEPEVSEGMPLEEDDEKGDDSDTTQTKVGGKGIRMGLDEKPDIPVAQDGGHESKGLPEKVIGNGIEVTVRLSLKTLALYQVAHTMDSTLSLGDYLDQCSEDFWVGRGKDLGILELPGEGGRKGLTAEEIKQLGQEIKQAVLEQSTVGGKDAG